MNPNLPSTIVSVSTGLKNVFDIATQLIGSVCFQGKIHCNNRASSQKCGIIDAREMTRNREKPCIWRPKCTSES